MVGRCGDEDNVAGASIGMARAHAVIQVHQVDCAWDRLGLRIRCDSHRVSGQ